VELKLIQPRKQSTKIAQANWTNPFSTSDTRSAKFWIKEGKQVDVTMMHQRDGSCFPHYDETMKSDITVLGLRGKQNSRFAIWCWCSLTTAFRFFKSGPVIYWNRITHVKAYFHSEFCSPTKQTELLSFEIMFFVDILYSELIEICVCFAEGVSMILVVPRAIGDFSTVYNDQHGSMGSKMSSLFDMIWTGRHMLYQCLLSFLVLVMQIKEGREPLYR